MTLDGTSAPSRCPYTPAPLLKIPDPPAHDPDAFGAQQRPLELQVAAKTAQSSARSDDPMAGHVRGCAFPHDVSDGAARPRVPGSGGHVPVGREAARGDASHERQHAGPEHSQNLKRSPAPACTPPIAAETLCPSPTLKLTLPRE